MAAARFDIDVRQWRALMKVSFLTLRRQQSRMGLGSHSNLGGLWASLLFYGIMGVLFAIAPNVAPAPGPAAFILISFVVVFISSMVLLEFGSSIVSPDDILVLGTRPVSSRTYFAARLSAVVIFVLLYTAALGGPSVVTFAHRFGIVVGLAWLLAVTFATLSAGLFMVVLYTTALRHVSPSRIRNVMGYVQLALSFLIYGGYGLLSERLMTLVSNTMMPRYSTLLPPAWFASFVALAAGDGSTANWLGVALSVVTLGGLLTAISGKISLTYAESVSTAAAEAPSAAPQKRASSGFGLLRLLLHPEDRAIALLVLRQFRYDVKFKMSVLAIVPLTFLYLYQGTKNGAGLVDPFVTAGGFGPSALLYVAVILFPVMLKNEIVRSDMYQASWIFFATPVQRGELMLSVRRVIMALFVAPYLALLSLVFLYFFRHPGHVVLHMIVLYLASDLFLQALFLILPQLPFSRPRVVGERVTAMMAAMMVGPFFFLGTMALFTYFLYPSLWLYAAGVTTMAVINICLRAMLKGRATRAGERLECSW